MNKRYGRNQKRQHREQIKTLEYQLYEQKKLYKHMLRQTAIARDIVDLIRRVNPHSVALEPAIIDYNTYMMMPHEQVRPLARLANDEALKCVDLRRINLYDLETELFENDEFKEAVHVRVRLKSRDLGVKETLGYRISLKGLHHAPLDLITHEIALPLARALKGA